MAASNVGLFAGVYSGTGGKIGLYATEGGFTYTFPMNFSGKVPSSSSIMPVNPAGNLVAWPYAASSPMMRALYVSDPANSGWWPLPMTGSLAPSSGGLSPGEIAVGHNSLGQIRLYLGAYDNLNNNVYAWFVDVDGVV